MGSRSQRSFANHREAEAIHDDGSRQRTRNESPGPDMCVPIDDRMRFAREGQLIRPKSVHHSHWHPPLIQYQHMILRNAIDEVQPSRASSQPPSETLEPHGNLQQQEMPNSINTSQPDIHHRHTPPAALESKSETRTSQRLASHAAASTQTKVSSHPATRQPTKVIVLGNPGVGKSTIQNTLLGEVVFKSGISLGGGLTKDMATCTRSNVTYVDTPGLDDVYNRPKAAEKISEALRGPCTLKLVFVTALEAGRVRSADLSTLHTIMSALRNVVGDMRNRYTLIVNKCDPSVERRLNDIDCAGSHERVFRPFQTVEEVRHLQVIGLEPSAKGKNNMLLGREKARNLQHLIEHAPTIQLPGQSIVRLDVTYYEERRNQIEEEMNPSYNTCEATGNSNSSGTNMKKGKARHLQPAVAKDIKAFLGRFRKRLPNA